MTGEPPEPRELPEPRLTTADLAPSANRSVPSVEKSDRTTRESDGVPRAHRSDTDAELAPLFTQDAARDFRSRWDVVQRGFVDDPQEAVRAGDELVAQVIKNLAETFSSQRAAIEHEMHQAQVPSTESLRLALRSYRSFFERLLAI